MGPDKRNNFSDSTGGKGRMERGGQRMMRAMDEERE